MNLGVFRPNRPAHQFPIDWLPGHEQFTVNSRLPSSALHISEPGALDRSCYVRLRRVVVEVTGNNQHRIRIVLGSIRQRLFDLVDSASVLSAALQVQVVGNRVRLPRIWPAL